MFQEMRNLYYLPVMCYKDFPGGSDGKASVYNAGDLGLSLTLLACEMSAIVQWFEYSLALSFFEIRMKTDFFSPVATAELSKLAGILSVGL